MAEATRGPHSPVTGEAQATRVFLRPIANPLAVGFLGLAGATLVLSGQELGWVPAADRVQVALIVMVFAPVLQLLACVFGFLARDAVAATGMGVLAVSWELVGVVHLLSPAHRHSFALGTMLMVSATGLLLSATTASTRKGVPSAVMATTGLRFLTTGIYELGGGTTAKFAAGVLGCFLAALAVYAAFATELEGERHATVLPMLRRGPGKSALEPYLDEQVRQVAAEPGVRREL